ncbi:MAG: hypothetical protein LUG50_08945 [Planctomycetaceae bacterium]|nr:hypothetical protein [Planctomycetaceae bacterium]
MTADDAFDKLLAKNALNIPVARPADPARGAEGGVVPPAPSGQPEAADPSGPARMPVSSDLPSSEGGSRVRHRSDAGGQPAMRVENVFDGSEDDIDDFIDADVGPFAGPAAPGASGDYRPPVPGAEEENGVFSTPTETDLEAVDYFDDMDEDGNGDGAIEMASAHRRGARVVGRDADSRDNEDEFALPDYDDDDNDNGDSDGDDEYYPDGNDDDNGLSASARSLPPSAEEAGLKLAKTVRRFSFLPLSGMDQFESGARDLVASLRSQNPERPSLAVTAARRGDGQTEIAIRLGLAAAKRVDYRVLLVDFDVRRPQMAVRLGVTAKYFTLTDVLRGACRLGEALTFSEEDNLYILPARPTDRPGDEVLDDRQVASFFRQAHAVFDFTVLVCGSLDHPDPVIVCRHAGAAAVAGFCGFSRVGAIKDAADTLTEAGVKVAGMLLTGA